MAATKAYARVAAVTGANKGIGLAIVRNLALQYPTSPLNTGGPLLVYLTARDPARGAAALAALETDPALASASALLKHGGQTDIAFHPLDVASAASVSAFAAHLAAQHPGGIDVVVNNAGVALDGFSASIVRATLDANYYGALRVATALLPRVRPGGRVVNVSSMVGKLNKYPAALTARFRAARSVGEVSALMEEFHDAVSAGEGEERGWPRSAYAVSKTGVTAATVAMGKQLLSEGSGVLVNCCCPGYVKTDLTKGGGRRTPDEGARTPVKLALGELGGVGGEFWEHEEVSRWF